MDVVIAHDATEVARDAADAVANAVLDRPAPVIGLATGSCPLPTYEELIARHRRGELPGVERRGRRGAFPLGRAAAIHQRKRVNPARRLGRRYE